MAKKRKTRSLNIRKTSVFAFLMPGILLALLFIITITFGILYVTSGNFVFAILLISLDAPLAAIYIASGVFEVRSLHRVYGEGMFEITNRNMRKLSKGSANLESYPKGLAEFDQMNASVEALKVRYGKSVFFAPDDALSKIDLNYLDRDHHLVSEAELKSKLFPLIDASRAYYCGLMLLFYGNHLVRLTPKEKEKLLYSANRNYEFVSGRLFAFNDNDELICFLPAVDSFSIIKEKYRAIAEEATVAAHLPTGLTLLPLKSAFVCYPFSSVDDIWNDLIYARRQDGVTNDFNAMRYENNNGKINLSSHSADVSLFHAILRPLVRLNGANPEEEKAIIKSVFDSLMRYVGAEECDIIAWEKNTNTYYSFFEDALTQRTYEEEKIKRLREVIDDDNSYYFSSRASLSERIARDNDPFGRESGFWYVFDDGSDILGVLYLFKKSGTLALDAYKKEGLLRFGRLMTNYFSLLEKERRARAFQAETEHVLSLGTYGLYKTNDSSYSLTYISPNLRISFPHAEVGAPCYKGLYGLDRPCPKCPLKKFAKMESKVGKEKFVTSLTLNDRKSHERSLLVEKTSEAAYDPYDRDWLVYSFRTLYGSLGDVYAISSRGYLLLLCLDNIEEFIKKQGSEGLNFAVRSFVEKIKAAFNTHDVYVYNPSTLGVLFPRVGHAEIIDCCEKIYNLSKENFYDDGTGTDSFQITYLPLGYPQGFASASDFLAHVEEHYRKPELKHGIDYIYFHNHSISCPACRKDYMSAIIDRTFSGEDNTCVTLQPMLSSDKHIFGAEILIRVNDDYRQRPIRADELSKIAIETGKVSIITTFLIHFVEALYAEFGTNVFAINDFHRVAINTDSSFLGDEGLLDYLKQIAATRSIPTNFLSFEISEDLISDELEGKSKAFTGAGIALVADRYTGRYVSLAKLKEYGFGKFKIDRGLICDLETNPVHKQQVLELIAEAKTLGLKVGAVGVENAEQFIILKDAEPTIEVQGFHFYKPLSRSDLINALRSHN